jgi:C4-dicarboxylate-specific signal transduction histidine kinase
LEPLLSQVVDELRLPGRVIEVDFKIDQAVNCDRSRIAQMLSNLLGNALTHGDSNKPVTVHAETSDGLFELCVANAGQPIPAAAMNKLFEPFFRGNTRASRQGLGLGLYIASQIAKAHDGELTVISPVHLQDAARARARAELALRMLRSALHGRALAQVAAPTLGALEAYLLLRRTAFQEVDRHWPCSAPQPLHTVHVDDHIGSW